MTNKSEPFFMGFKFIIFILLAIVYNISAQRFTYGCCPAIEPMENIYLRRYMGLWYQHASIRPVWKMLRRCVKFNYTIEKRGVFYVESSYENLGENKPRRYFGIVNPTEYTGIPMEADFEVKYFNWFRNITGLTTQLYVLATDYDSYSVEYSCTEVVCFNIQRLQVLVRDPNANSDVVLQKALKALEAEEIGFLHKHLKLTNKNCTTN